MDPLSVDGFLGSSYSFRALKEPFRSTVETENM